MNRPIPPLARSHGSAWFRIGAAATIVAMSASLAACSGSARRRREAAASNVTIGENADAAPNGYDPLLYSQGQFQLLRRPLRRAVRHRRGRQGRSRAWSQRPPSSTRQHELTLKLASGVTFTDGSTLDSAARQAEPRPAHRRDARRLRAARARPAAARSRTSPTPDASTVVITWAAAAGRRRRSSLADEPGMIVGSKGVANPASLKTTPDGSGPYTLDTGKTTRGSTYTLTRTRRPWNAKASPTTRSSSRSSPTRRRWPTRSSPARSTSPASSTRPPSTLVKSKQERDPGRRHDRRLPGRRQDRQDQPGVRQGRGPAGAELRDRPRDASSRTCTRAPRRPRSCSRPRPRLRPGAEHQVRLRPGQGQAAARAAGYPNGFSIDLTVAGPADRRRDRHAEAVGGRSA